MVMTITSLARVKAGLSAYVESVQRTHERVTITKNGEPAAVLISCAELESLEETIALLADAAAMAEIAQGEAEISRGEVRELSDVRLREVRLDGQ